MTDSKRETNANQYPVRQHSPDGQGIEGNPHHRHSWPEIKKTKTLVKQHPACLRAVGYVFTGFHEENSNCCLSVCGSVQPAVGYKHKHSICIVWQIVPQGSHDRI